MKNIALALAGARPAVAVLPTPTDPAETILDALALPPYQAVLVVLGGAGNLDKALWPRLVPLFGRGLARAAHEAHAVIVDGGTQAGVMALMGEGLTSQGLQTPLVGVAPASLTTWPDNPAADTTALEPNHSHFVLTPGTQWGSETATLFGLVQALIARPAAGGPPTGRLQPAGPGRVPALVVLAGGGGVAAIELVQAVRQRLPVLVLAGSGGLADQLAAAWATRDTPPDDPNLAEIVADGLLRFYPITDPAPNLQRLVVRELGADQG